MCRYVLVNSSGLSNGARAGVTLAALAGLALLVGLPITLNKRRKAARRAAKEHDARAKLMGAQLPSSSTSSDNDAELGGGRCCSGG